MTVNRSARRTTMTQLAAFVALSMPLVLACQARAGKSEARRYALPETEVWDMQAAHGEAYRVYVSRPDGEVPEDGYPVLFVLDGNAMFAGFAETRRILGVHDGDLEEMIVVGVGYPNEEMYDGRRLGDFTPPIGNSVLKERFKDYPSGRRELFKSFLLSELRPAIANRYPVNPARVSLYGHSLGGLFGLHVMYSDPGAFFMIIAASPSIWWDDQVILADERAFRARLEENPALGHAVRVKILVGELEEVAATVDDSKALAERLEQLSIYGVRSEFYLLDRETHITVPSRSVTIALRAAMEWP